MLDVFFTPDDLAKRWKCRAAHVRELIGQGKLVATNVALNPKGGKPRWRISPEAVEVFELLRSTAPAAVKQRAPRRKAEGIIEFF